MAAQTPGTGAITGNVLDPAGLPINHAHVLVVNESTKVSRTVDTTGSGEFTASLLTPGPYSVTVQQPGLEEKGQHTVLVTVGETSTLTVHLSIATAGETVEVNGDTELAQTQSATLGRTVDAQAIVELPLSTRNFTQILMLSPGVTVALPNAGVLGNGSQNVTDNGNKNTGNNIQFNGIDANNLARNSAETISQEVGVAIPAPDTILEFKVQTANYDASYGRGTGANVDLITKAGTNHFHGSAWEYVRNNIFNANTFYGKVDGVPRPELKQNQFGVSLGGPVWRDKLFFFGAYQGTRQVNGLGSSRTIDLPALGADRSAATIGATFCQSGFQEVPGATFAGGETLACDGSNINPVALKLLNLKTANGQFLIPSPQVLQPVVAGDTPMGQSTFFLPGVYNEDQYTGNIDYAISSKDLLTERFFYSGGPTTQGFAPNAANIPGWGNTQQNQNVMAVLAYSHVFNSSLVNLARVGFTRFAGNSVVTEPVTASAIGTESPQGTAGPGDVMPSFSAGGFSAGDGGTPFLKSKTNMFLGQDTVSMTHGRQSLSAGVEFKHYQQYVDTPYVSSGVVITATFNDFLIGQSAAQNGSPTGMSNINVTAASAGSARKDERYSDFAGFLQDNIRLTQRLSVFTGVRYEIFGPPTEAHQRFASFDPAIADDNIPVGGSLSGFLVPANFPGPLPAGVARTNRNGFWPTKYTDVSPRIGFALRLTDAPTVLLRGGYGIYFDRLSAGLVGNLIGQSPFALDQTNIGEQAAGATLQAPFSPVLPLSSSFPTFIPRLVSAPQAINTVDPNITDPYSQEWNLNLQTELGHDFLLEVGYVGTRSIHIPGGVEFNQALLASPEHPVNGETTNTTLNVVQRVPFQGISTASINYQTRFGANYNSLQTSLTKRLSHGLQFLASYTWSRNFDLTSGTGGGIGYEEWLLSNDQNNPKQAYGLTDFDQTNRAVLSLVYNIPSAAAYNRAERYVLSNWQISTIAVAESGHPITITDGLAGAVYGNMENRAAAPIGNPYTSGSMFSKASLGGRYLNRAAFPSARMAPNGVSAADTDFGDSKTNFLRGPAQRNIDFAVERAFPITKQFKFDFRAEFFNLTNTTNFGNPVADVSSTTFGEIGGQTNNPRIIQFAGKVQF